MKENGNVEKPESVTQGHLEYLDSMRESGKINMYGAGPYLLRDFGVSRKEAREILDFWMKSFAVRHGER